MRPSSWKDLIPEVAKATGQPEDKVKAIVQAYYKEIQSSMTDLTHLSVNVRELGVFKIKPKRLADECNKLAGIIKGTDISTMKNYSMVKATETKLNLLTNLKENWDKEYERKKKLRDLRYGKNTTDTDLEKQG